MNTATKIVLGAFGFLLIVIGLMAWRIHYLNEKIDNPKLLISQTSISTNVKPISTYKDSMGQNHVVISGTANTIKDVELKKANVGTIKLLDTIGLALRLSLKDKEKLDQVTQVNLVLSQSNLRLQKKVDSLTKVVSYSYKDKYITLNVIPKDSSMIANYNVHAKIDWVDYSKKKWLLGEKIQYTDIFSDNPNILIGDLQRVTIKHDPSTFGLRFKASSSYGFKSGNINLGPGLELDFGRINVSGYYFRNLNQNQWTPVVRLDYNILNF